MKNDRPQERYHLVELCRIWYAGWGSWYAGWKRELSPEERQDRRKVTVIGLVVLGALLGDVVLVVATRGAPVSRFLSARMVIGLVGLSLALLIWLRIIGWSWIRVLALALTTLFFAGSIGITSMMTDIPAAVLILMYCGAGFLFAIGFGVLGIFGLILLAIADLSTFTARSLSRLTGSANNAEPADRFFKIAVCAWISMGDDAARQAALVAAATATPSGRQVMLTFLDDLSSTVLYESGGLKTDVVFMQFKEDLALLARSILTRLAAQRALWKADRDYAWALRSRDASIFLARWPDLGVFAEQEE